MPGAAAGRQVDDLRVMTAAPPRAARRGRTRGSRPRRRRRSRSPPRRSSSRGATHRTTPAMNVPWPAYGRRSGPLSSSSPSTPFSHGVRGSDAAGGCHPVSTTTTLTSRPFSCGATGGHGSVRPVSSGSTAGHALPPGPPGRRGPSGRAWQHRGAARTPRAGRAPPARSRPPGEPPGRSGRARRRAGVRRRGAAARRARPCRGERQRPRTPRRPRPPPARGRGGRGR